MDENDSEIDQVVLATEIVENLNNSYPGRQKQIELLYNLLGSSGERLPASLYVYGDAATGKSQVIKGVLSLASTHFAFINCIESYTTRLLLEPVLEQLLEMDYIKELGGEKCDNMMVLVKQLRVAAHKGKLTDKPCIIVLENCEKLFDLGEHYFLAFQKLQELTTLPNLCVVFVSQILPEKFSTDVPYISIFFPQYTKDEVLKILMREIQESEDETLLKQFIMFFLDTFYLATRDLNELKLQMSVLFPKYIEPVKAGKIKAGDTHALYKNIAPHIKTALNNVYLPGILESNEQSKTESVLSCKTHQSLDLPYYAKYFLIAAFLASYNSPKDDKRLFVKNHGKKKKKRLVQDQKKENASRELLGPKIFTLDRLLAIFYAIMEEKTSLNANLLVQISTLVELRLLVRLGDHLDKPKYKCAVGIDCVEAVSRTLDFNVRKYMVH